MRILLRADDFLTKCINRLAIEYDGGVHVKHRLMKYHDFFVERISPGERVLDVGCGYGAVAYSVASRAGAVVVGIDLRAENIVKARQLFQHPNLSFLQGDVLRGLPKESFDVIMLSNILEHIEQRVEFLTIVHERLSPQRCLIRCRCLIGIGGCHYEKSWPCRISAIPRITRSTPRRALKRRYALRV